jgi:DNA-binding CsgD family transcriptional regulator
VLEGLRPEMDDGLGVVGMEVDVTAPSGIGATTAEVGPTPPGWRAAAHATNLEIDARSHAGVYRARTVAVLSAALERRFLEGSAVLRKYWDPWGARDALGLVIADGTSRAFVISSMCRETRTLDRQARWGLEQRAAHIAAGLRLRRKPVDPPAAIVSPGGLLLDATPAAQSGGAREALKRHAIAVDRARGRLRKRDPAAAMDLWQGLCAGEWSLVERFESDGRRYYVARANGPDVPGPPPLTARERQVAALAVMGRPNKLIGYSLGLSPGSVSTHLRAAATKLGVRTRVELVQLGAAMASAGGAAASITPAGALGRALPNK